MDKTEIQDMIAWLENEHSVESHTVEFDKDINTWVISVIISPYHVLTMSHFTDIKEQGHRAAVISAGKHKLLLSVF